MVLGECNLDQEEFYSDKDTDHDHTDSEQADKEEKASYYNGEQLPKEPVPKDISPGIDVSDVVKMSTLPVGTSLKGITSSGEVIYLNVTKVQPPMDEENPTCTLSIDQCKSPTEEGPQEEDVENDSPSVKMSPEPCVQEEQIAEELYEDGCSQFEDLSSKASQESLGHVRMCPITTEWLMWIDFIITLLILSIAIVGEDNL